MMSAAAGRKASHRSKKTWILLPVIVILLAGSAATWYFLKGPGAVSAQAASQEAPYQTATARRGSLRNSITGSGQLIAGASADLSFATSGKIGELKVAAGDTVKAGQTLASLSSTEALEAAVANAEVALLQAQQYLTDLQENADVALAQSYSDYVSAKSALTEAQAANARVSGSRCSSEVNLQNSTRLDQAREYLERQGEGSDLWVTAKAAYDTALANYQYCLTYTDDEKTGATAGLDLAENTLKQAGLQYEQLKAASGVDPDEIALAELTLTQAEANLAAARENLTGATLTAPMDGVVTYLAGSEGEIVGTDLFLTISNLDHPTVTIQVDESDLPNFVVGLPISVVFDALPDDTFTGALTVVDPELTTSFNVVTATGKGVLDAGAADRLRVLPLGLNGTVEIIAGEVDGAVLVPAEAVHDLGDGQYGVFVLSNGSLRLRVVEIGLSNGTYTAITSGVEAGETVSTGNISTGGN